MKTFLGKVRVCGKVKETEITEENGFYRVNEPIAFKHRTGTKTYTVWNAQVQVGRNGVYSPVVYWILRKPTTPVAWGHGTTDRVFY